ncbi:kinase-like domain-containing protein [Lanmaoa asiatica]|nr:kinase-like domain-containing protein [Lanmaoa asiatica]
MLARHPLSGLYSFIISVTDYNILTVADDLLKNDGQKFLDMMERLVGHRMQRSEEAVTDDSDDEEGEEDEDKKEDEDDDKEVVSEELTIEEGKRVFSILAARMFEQHVLQAYREKVAQERQQRLLRELEDEDKLTKEQEAKKQTQTQKKKDKKRRQQLAKEEERVAKAAEKAAEEAAMKSKQQAHQEEMRKKKEEEKARRESARIATEEKQREEEERRKRLSEEREREAERERKRKEREEKGEVAKKEQREREERQVWFRQQELTKDLFEHITRDGKFPVAAGGCAEIYRGTFRAPQITTKVAVKAIRVYSGEDNRPKKTKRVRREVKVWMKLDHTNVLPLFGTTSGFGPFPAMVCPWLENGTLTSYLERSNGDLEILQVLALVFPAVHSQSVVHGDLSGSNVLIEANGKACIADFGLSTILDEIGSTFATSSTGKPRGTLRWAAPEMLDPPNHEDVKTRHTGPTMKSDIYSFGSIMLQVCDVARIALPFTLMTHTCDSEQILSGKVPYYYYLRDVQVVAAIVRGETPTQPDDPRVTENRWRFIQRCWSPVRERCSIGLLAKRLSRFQEMILSEILREWSREQRGIVHRTILATIP